MPTTKAKFKKQTRKAILRLLSKTVLCNEMKNSNFNFQQETAFHVDFEPQFELITGHLKFSW